ncbi:DUF6520 family protein [Winogradskyella vidalii]|uniref:DUF6520 family protein n=1 Tax=Winogradskyella vidalii TaxID=2615024 RepID=UPI0015CC0E63|nr:DUF6520 family protein [Winogradskyella vidalii]
MKTKIIKTALPFMVFMLAIVFAFATEKIASNEDEAFVTGYIMQSGLCVPTTKQCDQVNLYPCNFNGEQVFELRDSATSCSIPLFHSQED